MNPANWFEIPVTNMSRAQSFYEHVFGYTLDLKDMWESQMAWFPMHDNASGATGSLVAAEGYMPSKEGTVVYFSVPSIGAALKKVEERGGKTLIPETDIGEFGFFAHFEDSEGNRIALHSEEGS